MSLWRRSGRLSGEQSQADRLADQADALEMTAPGTAPSVEAAERSVAAAVRQLMRFSDQPDRIQAALMVTLHIRAASARRVGDHQAAQQAESQAGRILPLLGRRDPAYFIDLAPE